MPVRKIDGSAQGQVPAAGGGAGGQHSRKGSGNRKTVRLLVGVIVVIALIVAGVAACSAVRGQQERAAHAGKVQVPVSSYGAEGENYEDVETMFENAGFTSVTAKGEGDLIAGLLHKEGDVDSVAVDGSTTFSKGDWVSPDAKVTIRYHSYPKRSGNSGSSGKSGGSEKKQRDAFDSSEKTTAKVAGLSFEVPDYFKKDKDSSGKDSSYYYAAKGKRQVMLGTFDLGTADSASAEDFYAQEEELADSFIDGTGFKKTKRGDIEETEVGGCPAFSCEFTGKTNGIGTTDELVFFFNEESGDFGLLCLIQSDKASYDYSSDFDKIVASAKAS